MKVVTTGEVSRVCGVAPRTVVEWIDSGALKGFRIPGSLDRRVSVESLEPFLRSHGLWGENGLRQTTLENYVMVVTRRPEIAAALVSNQESFLPVEVYDCAMSAGLRISSGAPRMAIIDLRDVDRFSEMAQTIKHELPLVELITLQKNRGSSIRRASGRYIDPINPDILKQRIDALAANIPRSK